jgi:hypothetical protein
VFGFLKRASMFRGLHAWNAKNVAATSYYQQSLDIQTEQLKLGILTQLKYQDPKHLCHYDTQVFSQTGMDGILGEVFRRIGTSNRQFIEIGVEDGTETNSTFWLWQGWGGVWVEGSPTQHALIYRNFRKPIEEGRLKTVQAIVTAENVNECLDAVGAHHEADLLSLDIDRNTFWVLKALTCRPRVLVVEYNASVPSHVDWCVPYVAQAWWDGSENYGAGLKCFEQWGNANDYRLVACDLAGINAVFIRGDIPTDGFTDLHSAEELYEPRRAYFARSSLKSVTFG